MGMYIANLPLLHILISRSTTYIMTIYIYKQNVRITCIASYMLCCYSYLLMAETSAKDLFELYNPGLLACLPMSDITFLEVLKQKGLLPDDVRNSLEQIDETNERSSYFLERIIKTGFDDGNDTHFINLLAAMMQSSHDIVKDLAIEIQNKLDVEDVTGMLSAAGRIGFLCKDFHH